MTGAAPKRRWWRRLTGRQWAFAAVLAMLVIVAFAAAVLSFDAIRSLAVKCGFAPGLAWLLPIAIDAGAAAGVIVWLVRMFPTDARRFAAWFAAVMLGVSVAANFASHLFDARRIEPEWWCIGIVSAVAPATLWVIVHLTVLAFRREDDVRTDAHAQPEPEPAPMRIVRAPVSLAQGVEDEALTADTHEGDGYSATVRRDAAEFGVELEKAPSGESKEDRRARLGRVRGRVARAKARGHNPEDPPGALVRVGAAARGD